MTGDIRGDMINGEEGTLKGKLLKQIICTLPGYEGTVKIIETSLEC